MINDDSKLSSETCDAEKSRGVTRREFIKYTTGTAVCISFG